jgi:hypothetical protein
MPGTLHPSASIVIMLTFFSPLRITKNGRSGVLSVPCRIGIVPGAGALIQGVKFR